MSQTNRKLVTKIYNLIKRQDYFVIFRWCFIVFFAHSTLIDFELWFFLKNDSGKEIFHHPSFWLVVWILLFSGINVAQLFNVSSLIPLNLNILMSQVFGEGFSRPANVAYSTDLVLAKLWKNKSCITNSVWFELTVTRLFWPHFRSGRSLSKINKMS